MNTGQTREDENMEFASEQTSAKGTDNKNLNYELIKRVKVVGTPFTVVTTDKGSMVTWGNNGLSKWFKGEKAEVQATTEAKKINWNKLLEVFSIMLTENNKLINNK